MTLPKPLILETCELTNGLLPLEDEDGSTLDFMSFGEIDYQDHQYLYGMEFEDFDQCFGNPNSRTMKILLLEIQADETGEPVYTPAQFSEEEEKEIFEQIQFELEKVRVASKYNLN